MLSALINPSAVALLKGNAYAAARQFLKGATESTMQKAADDYVKFVQPKTSRALSVAEIVRDANFQRIARSAKESPKKIDAGDSGFGGTMFGSIPNVVLYGGIAAVGYYLWKKHKKKKRKTTRRSKASTVPTFSTMG